MPRDNDGYVTLPPGVPAVGGTAISAPVMNAVLADIAAMLEDSLSRSGDGGMLNPIQYDEGSASSPSITFTVDTDTGIFHPGENIVGVAAGGTEVSRYTATGQEVTGDLAVSGDLDVTGTLTFSGTLPRSSLPAVGVVVASSSTAGWSTTSATLEAVTNATLNIESTGRPVMVMLQGDGTGSAESIRVEATALTGAVEGRIRISRTGALGAFYDTIVGTTGSAMTSLAVEIPCTSIAVLDVVPVGAIYTYQLYALAGTSSKVIISNAKLVAYEL